MVILVKKVKIVQLQMGVESLEPKMQSGFSRLKHSFTIVEQKNLAVFLRGPSKNHNRP
jgi:hypothetical protein